MRASALAANSCASLSDKFSGRTATINDWLLPKQPSTELRPRIYNLPSAATVTLPEIEYVWVSRTGRLLFSARYCWLVPSPKVTSRPQAPLVTVDGFSSTTIWAGFPATTSAGSTLALISSCPKVACTQANSSHEVGIASNRGSACRGEYVPGPCTHRPSRHGSGERPKSVSEPSRGQAAEGEHHDWGEVVTR